MAYVATTVLPIYLRRDDACEARSLVISDASSLRLALVRAPGDADVLDLPQIFIFTPENSSIKTFAEGEVGGRDSGSLLTIHWRTPGVPVLELHCADDTRAPLDSSGAWARLHALWRPWQAARKAHVKAMYRLESSVAQTAAAAAAAYAACVGGSALIGGGGGGQSGLPPLASASLASPSSFSGPAPPRVITTLSPNYPSSIATNESWDDESGGGAAHDAGRASALGGVGFRSGSAGGGGGRVFGGGPEPSGAPTAGGGASSAALSSRESGSFGLGAHPTAMDLPPSSSSSLSSPHGSPKNAARMRALDGASASSSGRPSPRGSLDRSHVAVSQANLLAAAAVAAAEAVSHEARFDSLNNSLRVSPFSSPSSASRFRGSASAASSNTHAAANGGSGGNNTNSSNSSNNNNNIINTGARAGGSAGSADSDGVWRRAANDAPPPSISISVGGIRAGGSSSASASANSSAHESAGRLGSSASPGSGFGRAGLPPQQPALSASPPSARGVDGLREMGGGGGGGGGGWPDSAALPASQLAQNNHNNSNNSSSSSNRMKGIDSSRGGDEFSSLLACAPSDILNSAQGFLRHFNGAAAGGVGDTDSDAGKQATAAFLMAAAIAVSSGGGGAGAHMKRAGLPGAGHLAGLPPPQPGASMFASLGVPPPAAPASLQQPGDYFLPAPSRHYFGSETLNDHLSVSDGLGLSATPSLF